MLDVPAVVNATLSQQMLRSHWSIPFTRDVLGRTLVTCAYFQQNFNYLIKIHPIFFLIGHVRPLKILLGQVNPELLLVNITNSNIYSSYNILIILLFIIVHFILFEIFYCNKSGPTILLCSLPNLNKSDLPPKKCVSIVGTRCTLVHSSLYTGRIYIGLTRIS
jgi:hypothetical protein